MKFIFVLLTLVFSTEAFACSCASTSKEKHLEHADQVFLGIVENISLNSTTDTIDSRRFRGMEKKVQFTVSESFKGEDINEAIILTASESAACGINFQKGRAYVVFANTIKSEGEKRSQIDFRANSCGMTFKLELNTKNLDKIDFSRKNQITTEQLTKDDASIIQFLRESKQERVVQ